MDMIVENGRPSDCEGRVQKEIESYDFLDSIGVGFRRADHLAAFDMDVCEEISKVLDTHICKNLFLCNRQETAFYLLMMPGDKKFKTKDISSQIGSARLSFGNEEKMEELLNLTPGSVTLLGLMYDKTNSVRLIIDEDLFKHGTIGIHPCINTSTITISTEDMMKKIVPALRHEPTVVNLPWYTEQ